MDSHLIDEITGRLKPLFTQYDSNFQNFLMIGQRIDNSLLLNSDLLTEIKQRFNNLSASVELVLEGIEVFDSEIKRMSEQLKKSINNFTESISISEKISLDLNNISDVLKKIQNGAIELAKIIQNINYISESIEVASRNAGITAYHAGREGRGFEVIAREMTNLVRGARTQAKIIPEISHLFLKDIDELNDDLKKIQDIILYLKEISDKFLNINSELLNLVPYIENTIKEISNSITVQKELYDNLQSESKKLSEHLNEIYSITRMSAATEMFYSAFFQHLNNIKNSLLNAGEEHNFYLFYNMLRKILENEPRFEEYSFRLLKKLDIHTSERFILQFISEAKHLNEIINLISNKIKSWVKTNAFAIETLNRAKNFYTDIGELLNSLSEKSYKLKKLINRVENPLEELRQIAERSRLLGLYAGIESARSGKYAEALGVVTGEIKSLSIRSSEFISNIGIVEEQILKDIRHLITCFIQASGDVELGKDALNISIEAMSENSRVLENLSSLTQEMFSSTSEMVNQCSMLGEHHRNFEEQFLNIEENFNAYSKTVKLNENLTREIKAVIDGYQKEVYVITTERKKLVLRAIEDPIVLDPATKTDTTSHQVIEQIFTGLYTFDQSNHLIPGIAYSFAVSEDGKVWDFYLKKGVKFHNGVEVEAKDVVHSLNRVKKGPNAFFIEYLTDMAVIDPYHMRFFLKFPFVPFLSNLACGVCDIVPADFNPDKPVGCGPYKLVSYEKEKEIILEAFDDFYDGTPPIDECIIKIVKDDKEALELFKRGDISIMSLTADMLQEFSPDEIISGPVLSTQYLAINFSKKSPFTELAVRQAMNYALDKEYYCRTILKGKAIPAHGLYPPGLPGFNDKLIGYPYDLKKARDLMRQAGFGGGIDEEFVLDVRAGADILRRAEFIRESFAKIGIYLTINSLPWNEFLNKTYSGDSIMSLRGWVSDNGDPDNFAHTLFHSKNFGASGNTSFYANEELDRMIENARSEQNPRLRLELYRKIENFIVENALLVFISHGVDCYAVQKNVKGFMVDPFGLVRFRNLFIA